MARLLGLLALALVLAVGGCSSTGPDDGSADFVIAVGAETFVVRSTHAETIVQMREALAGRRSGFPSGPLRSGNGGFNAPWSWHLDPAETRMVDAAIEICDGTPSYVEQHQAEFRVYCPWGARVVSER